MTSLFKMEVGSFHALVGVLDKAGLTAELAEKVRHNPEMAKRMVAALRVPEDGHPYRGGASSGAELIHSLFTPISAQLTRVRELNAERNWGFTDEDFAEAEQSVPEWPDGELVAVTLVPYLPDGNGMGGVERTFQELWQVAASLQHANWRWDGYDKAGPDKLRLLEGIEHPVKGKPVLRWEVIDLGCNRNRPPVDVRNFETSPHAGILASAALHPEWVKAMDGDKVPYVWAPGYEVNVSGESPGEYLPNLDFDRSDRKIEQYYDWYGRFNPRWSVPSFARE